MGRKPNPAAPERRRRALDLRAQGLSMAEIGQRLGYTAQGAKELLTHWGRFPAPMGIIKCCRWDGVVAKGQDQLRNNGPIPCVECLAKQPDAPFGLRFKVFRMPAGLTRAALAKLVGFASLTVSACETGKDEQRWTNLVKLMRVLGTELVTLSAVDERRRYRPRKPW
jgi:DNA-binding XRE family transcriptional regulator